MYVCIYIYVYIYIRILIYTYTDIVHTPQANPLPIPYALAIHTYTHTHICIYIYIDLPCVCTAGKPAVFPIHVSDLGPEGQAYYSQLMHADTHARTHTPTHQLIHTRGQHHTEAESRIVQGGGGVNSWNFLSDANEMRIANGQRSAHRVLRNAKRGLGRAWRAFKGALGGV